MADLSTLTTTVRVRWWVYPLLTATAFSLRVLHVAAPRLGVWGLHRAERWFESHMRDFVKVG